MQRTAVGILAVSLAMALAGCGGSATASPSGVASATASASGPTRSPTASPVQAFTVTQLVEAQAASGKAYATFLDQSSMEAGLYLLSSGADDGQSAHARDEVYVVVTGAATLVVGGGTEEARVPVSAGSAVFVAGGTAHHFEQIADALQVLVVFVNGTPAGDPTFEVVSEAGGLSDAGAATHWEQTLSRSDVTAGLYWLPVSGGGDTTLRHKVDEINVVLSGAGTFSVEGEPIALSAGSVVFVPAGLGHSFATPDADLLDLIIFASP